jgi:hypothetical protein
LVLNNALSLKQGTWTTLLGPAITEALRRWRDKDEVCAPAWAHAWKQSRESLTASCAKTKHTYKKQPLVLLMIVARTTAKDLKEDITFP